MTPSTGPGIRELENALDSFLKGRKRPLATLLYLERKNVDFFLMLGELHVSYIGSWSHWQFVRASSDRNEELLAGLIAAKLHLHASSSDGGEGALAVVARHDWTDGVRLLRDAGCKLDEYSYSGYTPLHLAARDGAAAAVRLLLESGALKDAQTKDGDANTPLHCAAVCIDQVKAVATMEVLVAAGAVMDAKNTNSFSARDLAVFRRKRYSVEKFDEIVARKARGELELITVSPLAVPKRVNHAHPTEKKLGEAYAALVNGFEDKMAKCLKRVEIAHREDPSRTSGTAFPGWLMARFNDIVATRDEALLERVLRLGLMGWEQLSDAPETPLHLAAAVDWLCGVQQIIAAGASVEASNSSGETPLHTAIRARAARSVEFLVQYTFGGGRDTDSGDSVLHVLGQIDSPEAERICLLLLSAGSDPMAKNRAGAPVDESVLKQAKSYSLGLGRSKSSR